MASLVRVCEPDLFSRLVDVAREDDGADRDYRNRAVWHERDLRAVLQGESFFARQGERLGRAAGGRLLLLLLRGRGQRTGEQGRA